MLGFKQYLHNTLSEQVDLPDEVLTYEQAEYIRVYNHRNGKYYKLVMEELDE